MPEPELGAGLAIVRVKKRERQNGFVRHGISPWFPTGRMSPISETTPQERGWWAIVARLHASNYDRFALWTGSRPSLCKWNLQWVVLDRLGVFPVRSMVIMSRKVLER